MAEQNNKNKINPSRGKKPKFSFYWIYAILAIVFIGIQYFNYTNPVKEITWTRLEEMLVKQDVEKIVIVNKEKAEIYIRLPTIPEKICSATSSPICFRSFCW